MTPNGQFLSAGGKGPSPQISPRGGQISPGGNMMGMPGMMMPMQQMVMMPSGPAELDPAERRKLIKEIRDELKPLCS